MHKVLSHKICSHWKSLCLISRELVVVRNPFPFRVLIKTNYLKYFPFGSSASFFSFALNERFFFPFFNCALEEEKKQHIRKGLARAATRKMSTTRKTPRASHVDWQIGAGGKGTGCNQTALPPYSLMRDQLAAF